MTNKKIKFSDFGWGDADRLQYCKKCGEKLVPNGDIKVENYEAGQPIYKTTIQCPKYKLFSGHDKSRILLYRYFKPPVWQLHPSMYD